MTDRDVNERLLRLNAALDGELDAMGSLEFERELRDDPAIAAEYQRLTKRRDAVRRHAPREAAPQALADRIAAMTGSAPAAAAPPTATVPTATVVTFPRPRRAWLDSRALAMAASLGVLGFAVGAGLTSLRTPAGSPDAAQHLVSDFARAEIAGLPFDVASSDRHTVKPWLANRTTVSGTIVDLAPEGFPLVGGRVTIVDRVPTPTLVYRHNEHVVAVTELPVDAKGVRGGTGGIETIDGYHVVRWSDANLTYVAVSDMDEKALGEFVEVFRSGGGPATEPANPAKP
jgi:anti-sigma factor RsiW